MEDQITNIGMFWNHGMIVIAMEVFDSISSGSPEIRAINAEGGERSCSLPDL